MYKDLLRIFKLHNRLLSAHACIPAALRSTRAFPPLIVQLELTHRCNLNCPMCYQSRSANPSKELSAAEWKKLIDDLPAWSLLTLTGGDPFVRQDFDEIFSHAIAGHKCNILTNGELMTESQIRLMVDKGLLLIGISLDGPENTHDAIRVRKGLFKKTVENIKRIQAEKEKRKSDLPLIDIKTVILNENAGELKALHAIVDELGADFWSLSLPKISEVQFGNRYNNELSGIFSSKPLGTCLAPAPAARESLFNQLDDIKTSSGKVSIRFYPYNMLGSGPIDEYLENRLSSSDFSPCRIPWSFACVSPQGDVFPCLAYKAGNVREKTFGEIWNGPEFRSFRAGIDRKGLNECCLGCCYSVYRRGRHH